MKSNCIASLAERTEIDAGIFKIDFYWKGEIPQAGQFFLVKSFPSSVFLARPLSVLDFDAHSCKLSFLVAVKGAGTKDIASCRKAELTGPLGNGFTVLSTERPLALVAGGIGTAPLFALAKELRRNEPDKTFEFFAGFRERLHGMEKLLYNNLDGIRLCITCEKESGSYVMQGRVTDALDITSYGAVYACGPQALLKALSQSAKTASVPCFLSMERYMACGVGACLGCTVSTGSGNKRCCNEGPVFNALELLYD